MINESFTPQQGLFLDIEAVPGGRVFSLGAVHGASFQREVTGESALKQLLQELRGLTPRVSFIAGHNIIQHDLPILDATFGVTEFSTRPIIDTLYVSPLAFPQNPYHRLIKGDHLTPSSKNHPLRDSEASRTILEDATKVVAASLIDETCAQRWALIRWLFSKEKLPWKGAQGIAWWLEQLGVARIDDAQASTLWDSLTIGLACPEAARTEWVKISTQSNQRSALAYVLNWLPVAGGDSILPGWVRHRFQETRAIIHRMRCTPCANSECAWCSQMHSPDKQLNRFFGYPAFRPEPALVDHPNISLQREIVRQIMGGQSVLGILPTGGGKSLCFQVPALHRYYATGALTIVVTPLQALMKDQVDGLIEKTSATCVAALNGMQTPPEKAEVRDAIRLGSVGILYVSPEQLRNSSFRETVLQREIAYWVFDEAHCLSQWGHDFRPDYVYTSRYVRELAARQHMSIPSVICVTATAKEDVKNEIISHFHDELSLDLNLLDGGTERDNLRFVIEEISESRKPVRIQQLLTEHIGDGDGAAVVFAGTRERVETFSTWLSDPQRGWTCEAFHAGLDPEKKKTILNDYLDGRLQIVVATNAFGMGIDKSNIRLVIHADTPGSLENYLQEAGRAGRDKKQSECVLLFNPEDIETQFNLLAFSKLDKREIDFIWRAICRAESGDEKPAVLSVDELVNDEDGNSVLTDEVGARKDTKVRTALAVLEKQGFIERDDNQTRVFQARPLVADQASVLEVLSRLNLSEEKKSLWMEVMKVLLEQSEGGDLQLTDFSEIPQMQELYERMRKTSYERVSPYAPVFHVLNEMARPEVGLISKDILFSALVRFGKGRSSKQALKTLVERERGIFDLLCELEPNPDGWTPLNIRGFNQLVINKGHASLPRDLLNALRWLERDGRKMGRPAALLQIAQKSKEYVQLRLIDTWLDVRDLNELRHSCATQLLSLVLSKAEQRKSEVNLETLVEFSEKEIVSSLLEDISLAGALSVIPDLTGFIQYLLVYLHESRVFELRNGKAIITQAMSIRVLEKLKGRNRRRFTKGDYATLQIHYSEKTLQVHIMGEYARVGLEKLGAHLRLVRAYFQMGKAEFAARFLPEGAEVYTRATSIESFRKIVDNLRNPVQQAIVAEEADTNMLILAGPGSGKTRVVAHRCAFLLRVKRIKSDHILVVCFNRLAALQLKRQIYRLVGKESYGVTIQTYHGLALRLLGRSLHTAEKSDELPDFGRLLEDATNILTGKDTLDVTLNEETRDRVLAGFSHVLVDEYQDIDDREYALISAIAGRHESEEERKLTIMAVGDDDQSIYGFKGANVDFIRRFKTDYKASEHYLTDNYRSSRSIIDAANRLIALNTDRMKVSHRINVNRDRKGDPSGGIWEALDPVNLGKVQRVAVQDDCEQATFVADEVKRLRSLKPNEPWGSFAVLARVREDLVMIRAALEELEIPIDWRADEESVGSPFKIREVQLWLSYLNDHRSALWTSMQAKDYLISLRGERRHNRWWAFLDEIWSEWASENGETEIPVPLIRDFFAEAIAERKRHHRIGEGVALLTAHKSKGLEFPHVFIIDGGWQRTVETVASEEERRVFYVSMTRAMENLVVMHRLDRRNQFTSEIEGEGVRDRIYQMKQNQLNPWYSRRYNLVTLDEIYLSFAGKTMSENPIHKALESAEVGDRVKLHQQGDWIYLINDSNIPLAALSSSGKKKWEPRLAHIEGAKITAIIRRTTSADGKDTENGVVVEDWEIPIVEVCWRLPDLN